MGHKCFGCASSRDLYFRLFALTLVLAGLVAAAEASTARGPVALRADALVEPLGIDDPTPTLSWKLRDAASGAEQTAYRLLVYSASPGSRARADVWDSGRIASPVSNGVTYAGPKLEACHRYYWRVQLWCTSGTAYPPSAASWFETGLMGKSAWQGRWIGYESAELHSLRSAGAEWVSSAEAAVPPVGDTHHDFRLRFQLGKPVRRVALYAIGQDLAAAWINRTQVMEAQPLTPWKQLPWMTWSRRDVTSSVRRGDNVLAI